MVANSGGDCVTSANRFWTSRRHAGSTGTGEHRKRTRSPPVCDVIYVWDSTFNTSTLSYNQLKSKTKKNPIFRVKREKPVQSILAIILILNFSSRRWLDYSTADFIRISWISIYLYKTRVTSNLANLIKWLTATLKILNLSLPRRVFKPHGLNLFLLPVKFWDHDEFHHNT